MTSMAVDKHEGEEVEGEEEEVEKVERAFPDMGLAQKAFKLDCADAGSREAVKAEVMAMVTADSMAPFYEVLCSRHSWMVDTKLLDEIKAANAAELEKLEAALKDAKENQGEMEVLDGLLAIGQFYARIGDKANTNKAYDVIIEMPKVSTGKRIDAQMHKLRCALFFMDMPDARAFLVAAKKLVEEGGDWDRRNRLKVYEAVVLMVERDFKQAAGLLLDGVSTFTCVELMPYETFVYYAVVTNMLYLDRPSLKKKIVDGPDVLGVIQGLDPLGPMARGLYDCDYALLFSSLLPLHESLLGDRYLAPHARYLLREFRILTYTQFLASYKSVLVKTMAQAFGVGEEFLDSELSRFIAGGRLSAKIDKVGGKVETNPPDERNSQYQAVIKKGDMLLTSVQKLARVIDS
eukprot:CAMPEP_0172587242 /NCGR_PEP_ID=MMETSP1068-20121228/6316_1 /TAXON_ID=35684 /ORGANISM="Pseudopedinella elastica, Strain CCMP716" /LENGTH=404 /DNA_ID=CAMNT_0013382191 /DNA_START=71 /DNA_END=1285 /DNA_ORIENTATION=+